MSAADHLQVPRQHGLFHHHGIDLGDGTVAHYLEGREILRSPIKEFCNGERIKVVLHTRPLPTALTVQRATSRIGEQSYNLLFNNCEHFANWCKTGQHRSKQMEDCLKQSRLESFAFEKLMPKALLKRFNLLLKTRLENETSRDQAKQLLSHLEQIAATLRLTLDSSLKELESWFNGKNVRNRQKDKNPIPKALLLTGQQIEDQLNEVEKLKAQITALLKESNSKN